MAMSTLESGPKLDWTRDNQMFLRYKKWKSKVELIFRSALSKATPEEKTAYLKYWMGDEGLPLIEKWESTGKLDYSNAEETPATEGGRRRILSSGFKVQTYWDLLEEEFKPKGNKLISIIELWTRSKQGNKTLNEWLTYVYNLVEACNYGDSTDRIIRDVLIIGCESDRAKDRIIRRGETITLNETIEILQTEASTNSTLRQFQEIQSNDKKSTGSIYYQSYDSRSKKSKAPSNEQNSSSSPTGSTGSKRICFRCGEPFSRQHMKECRAQNVTCNGCGIKGHLKKCCKKSGNFPKDNSSRQNQSPSTGSSRMNFASTLPQTEADFFDEKGIPKQYIPQNQQQHTGSMYVLKKFQGKPNDILFSDNGIEIQHSVSDPDPAPIPTPDFPLQEFPLTEVVKQSQIDISSISDTSDPRESSNSSSKATTSTNFSLKSVQNCSSDEEITEHRDLTVSDKHTQSSRDSNTIFTPVNSATRKSNPGIITGITTGIMTDTPTTFSEETDVTAIHEEIPEELQIHSSNYRSVIPTDTQALTVLQNLISDDFQAKNTHSTQRKGEETPDTRSIQRKGENETFQLIQKIHNQLQEVQWDLQRLHSLHKYKN